MVLRLRLSLLSFQEVPAAHQLPDHLNSRRRPQGTWLGWVLAGQLWLVSSASWGPIKPANSLTERPTELVGTEGTLAEEVEQWLAGARPALSIGTG
jgi:hypothetical protein